MKKNAFGFFPSVGDKTIVHCIMVGKTGEPIVTIYEDDSVIEGVHYSILTEEQVYNLYKLHGIDFFINTAQVKNWGHEYIGEGYKKDLINAIKKLEVNSEW